LNSIVDLITTASTAFESQQISDSCKLDAELLMSHCLKQTRTYLYTWPEKILSENQQACFDELVQKRLQGQPIAHLMGEREFWGLNLKVTPDTLIPRPDTEILIETALQKLSTLKKVNAPLSQNQQACHILDLGTGTGAIALALKSELPACKVTAIDFSLAALEVAKHNALSHQLNIELIHSSWFDALKSLQQFDLIASNPPYIEAQDPHLTQGDVRFEPLSALTAGSDGLDDLKVIIGQACSFLKKDGWLLVEHGYNQAHSVATLFAQHDFKHIETIQDYGQNPRITLGQKTERISPC